MEIDNNNLTGDDSDNEDDLEESSNESIAGTDMKEEGEPEVPKKKKKRGIVYISSIPKYMTVAILREYLGRYASIGRVYLQAATIPGNSVALTNN